MYKIIKQEEINNLYINEWVINNYENRTPKDREENLQEKEKHIKEVEKKIKQEYDEKVKEGYDNGFRQGYNDGLEKAKNEIELKINKVLLEIEKEKNKIIDNVYNENINKIRELMKVVLEKLFLQYINDEQILLNYFDIVLENIKTMYEEFSLVMNKNTYELLQEKIQNIDVKINNNLKDYDFIVKTNYENIEYIMDKRIKKIKEILEIID